MKKTKNNIKDYNVKNKKKIKIVPSWKELNSKIKKNFIKKYSVNQFNYDNYVLENIIYNRNCHISSIFKDKMITNNLEEYLKKSYTRKESKENIKKFPLYYDNYLLFFCKPIFSEIYFNKLFLKFYEKKAEIFYNEIILEKEPNNYQEKSLSMNVDMTKSKDNKNIKIDKNFFNSTIVKAIDATSNKNNDSELTINTLNLNDNFSHNGSLINDGNRLITEFSEDKSFASFINVMNKNNKVDKNKTNLKLKLENKVNHVNQNIKKRNRLKNNSLMIINTNKTNTIKKLTNTISNHNSKFIKEKDKIILDKGDIKQNCGDERLNKKNSIISLNGKKIKKEIEKMSVKSLNNMNHYTDSSNNNTITNDHSNKLNNKVNNKFKSNKTLGLSKKRNLTKNKNNNNNNIKCLSTLNFQSIKTIGSPLNAEINNNKHIICSKHLSLPKSKCTKTNDNSNNGIINHLDKNTVNTKLKNYSQPEIISGSNKSCRQESKSKKHKTKMYTNFNNSQPIITTEANEQTNINGVNKRKISMNFKYNYNYYCESINENEYLNNNQDNSDNVVIIDSNIDNNEIVENNDNQLLYTSINIGNGSQDQTKNSIYLKGKPKKNNLSIDSTYSNKERENTNANTYTNTNNVLINSYKASFINSKRNSTKKITINTQSNSNRIKNNFLINEIETKNNIKKNKCLSKKSYSNGKQYIMNSCKNKTIKCNVNKINHIQHRENKLASSNMNIMNTSGNKKEINNKIISNKLSSLPSSKISDDFVNLALNERSKRNLTNSKQKKSYKKIINVESHNVQKSLKEKVSLDIKTELTDNENNRYTELGLLDGYDNIKNIGDSNCHKKESISIKNSRNKCNILNLINQKMKKTNHDVKDIKFLTNSINNNFKSKLSNVTNNTNVVNTNININNNYEKPNLNEKQRTKKVIKK